VSHLRHHPRIDAAKVGLWCFSQGGFIAPLVAARDPDIAFLIAVSPSGVRPAEQMTYAAAFHLREAGYPEFVVAQVTALRERIDQHYRESDGLKEARALVDEVRTEPWFGFAFLPDPANPASRWRLQMDLDVRAAIRRLRLPILLMFGEWDRWVLIEASVEAWRSALGPEADLFVASVPGAGHFPTLATDPRDWSERGRTSPHYEAVLISWLLHRGLGTPERDG
jgi:pimeloyl-ACP methyl ester carboxylesterase